MTGAPVDAEPSSAERGGTARASPLSASTMSTRRPNTESRASPACPHRTVLRRNATLPATRLSRAARPSQGGVATSTPGVATAWMREIPETPKRPTMRKNARASRSRPLPRAIPAETATPSSETKVTA